MPETPLRWSMPETPLRWSAPDLSQTILLCEEDTLHQLVSRLLCL